MVRGDIILHFQQHFRFDLFRERFVFGERLDVGSADHLYLAGMVRGRNDHIIVYIKFFRHLHVQDGKVGSSAASEDNR